MSAAINKRWVRLLAHVVWAGLRILSGQDFLTVRKDLRNARSRCHMSRTKTTEEVWSSQEEPEVFSKDEQSS